MRPTVKLPDTVTSFTDYFNLTSEYDKIAEALGYGFQIASVTLPRTADPLPWVLDLQTRMTTVRPRIRLTSEMARREFFISPLLLEIALRYPILIRTEFAVKVSEQLQGNIDYYIEGDGHFLIVEAKTRIWSAGPRNLSRRWRRWIPGRRRKPPICTGPCLSEPCGNF